MYALNIRVKWLACLFFSCFLLIAKYTNIHTRELSHDFFSVENTKIVTRKGETVIRILGIKTIFFSTKKNTNKLFGEEQKAHLIISRIVDFLPDGYRLFHVLRQWFKNHISLSHSHTSCYQLL